MISAPGTGLVEEFGMCFLVFPGADVWRPPYLAPFINQPAFQGYEQLAEIISDAFSPSLRFCPLRDFRKVTSYLDNQKHQ